MDLTDFHAKYYAHELKKRSASDSMEKLAGAVASAQVDLKPHQVDAALFAFLSPLSKGAILADEEGLGKTIEAVREKLRMQDESSKAVLGRFEQLLIPDSDIGRPGK